MMDTFIHLAMFTYFGAHWPLVIAAALAVLLFGVLGFMLRSPSLVIAALAVAVVGFVYQGAVTDGIKLQMARDAADQARLLQSHIDTMNAANEADAIRALDDQKTITQLQEQISAIPKNDSSCLDIDSARRLRGIE